MAKEKKIGFFHECLAIFDFLRQWLLRETYKGQRILVFITFYHNALHLTRVHCATNKSNKDTGKVTSFAAQTQSFLCSKFSTGRLEVLPNLRHVGGFLDEYDG